MSYLLDTNACIYYLNPGHHGLSWRVRESAADILLCAVVMAELYFGAYHSQRREESLAVLRRFSAQFPCLPFDDAAAEQCARIRADLHSAGTPIGPYDLQIAGIALASSLTLVTHNVREFRRVDGLRIEDWEAGSGGSIDHAPQAP